MGAPRINSFRRWTARGQSHAHSPQAAALGRFGELTHVGHAFQVRRSNGRSRLEADTRIQRFHLFVKRQGRLDAKYDRASRSGTP